LWERCWSSARILLGLSSAEFYRLTPRQYSVLMDRYREQAEHHELLAGILASTIANYSGKTLESGVVKEARDFMPSQAGKSKVHRDDRPEEVASGVRTLFGVLMEKQQQAERIKNNREAQKRGSQS
jgi:hypothetical protein